MDNLDKYRTIIENVLTDYAKVPYAYGDIASRVVIDCANNQYLLVNVGWDQGRRIHGCLIHLDIIDDKIWIQRDGTEEGIATLLLEAGIPKNQIVLAFRAPELRQHTGFATA